MIDIRLWLEAKGLIEQVIDPAAGVYLLRCNSAEPAATAYLKQDDVSAYLAQKSSEISPHSLPADELLQVHIWEEVGEPGWTSKSFGIRVERSSGRYEWFSEAELDPNWPAIPPGSTWHSQP